MNISAVSFGKQVTNNNYYTNQTRSYNYPQDKFYYSKQPQRKKTKKTNKLLLGALALLCASNIASCAKTPNTTNPNELSKSDLKTLYTFGNFVDKLDGFSTMDYVIEDTKQGKVADCWLLSTVNSLNNTDIGKEYIKNMFEYKNKETVVHLYTGDYTITNDELKIGKIRHSKGDEDMLLIELATEKALADYNDGKLILPEAVITEQLGGNGTFSTLNLGSQDAAMYILLGGNATYSQIQDNEEEVNFVLSELAERGNESFILTASIESGDKKAINDNGEEIELKGHHAYSVLEANDDYVTVVNPEDSSVQYKITVESFMETFNSITYLDLNEI